MSFGRPLIAGGSVARAARQADGFLAHLDVEEITADANQTITVAQMSRGAVCFTGFSAGRNLTTPTAAQIVAAFPDMDIGDSITMAVSIQDAFAGTWVAGTGVTLAGRATTPASSWSLVVAKKTSSTAVQWFVL